MRLMRASAGTQRRVLRPLAALLVLVSVAVSLNAEPATNAPVTAPASGLEIYNHGMQLVASGKLAEAYACFEAVVTNPPAHQLNYYAYNAEWYMGNIQEGLGQVELAVQHFSRALEIIKAKADETNDVWLIQRQLSMLSHVEEIYDRHGRMGLLYSTQVLRGDILNQFRAKQGGQVDFDKHRWWWDYSWGLKCDQALMFRRLARLDESDALMEQVVKETTGMGHPEDARMALEWLSEVAMLREHMDEAVLYREQGRSEALLHSRAKVDSPISTYRYVDTLVRRDGVSQRAWDLINAALDQISHYPEFEWTFQANLVKCEMLAIDGKTGPSMELLTAMIERGRGKDSQRMLPLALKQRAQLRLDIGEIAGADADAKESLALYRALGWKRLEPDLYEIHAQCLGRQGRYAEAFQIWQDAYQMCENLKLHHRSLHMLLRIADLQLHLGNKAALERAWTRIDAFVRAHPDLPEPTQLRLRLARLDYLKAKGDRDILMAAYQETQQFVGNSKLTPYQARAWTAYPLDQSIQVASIGAQPLPKVDPARSGVDLQPILTTTRVATGELAHARFDLVNPSATTATGLVRLASAGWRGEWTPTDQGWKITLTPDRSATAAVKPLSLAPGTAAALFFEAPTATPDTTNGVTVTWQGDTIVQAQWQFGAIADQRAVAIVNASLAEENPFYSVVFYHELFYRGQTQRVENLRVTASQPCRVELLDVSAGKLLAVDASGDGDFEDAGDVLGVDTDGDGYPDFVLSPEQDVARFELLAYPTMRTNSVPKEIEITLWRRESGAWVDDAVDVLRTQ
jgi:tetratricopeptide (TPR) repeat protein